jgi:hypothetical protein
MGLSQVPSLMEPGLTYPDDVPSICAGSTTIGWSSAFTLFDETADVEEADRLPDWKNGKHY